MTRSRHFCSEGEEATQQNCRNHLPTALSSRLDADGARSGCAGWLSRLGHDETQLLHMSQPGSMRSADVALRADVGTVGEIEGWKKGCLDRRAYETARFHP